MGKPAASSMIRAVLRRDIILVCLAIFIADVVSGILTPTFPVFAQTLGASLTMVGVIGSAFGLAQAVASIPIGMLSDAVGRKTVLSLGFVGWAAATALFAFTSNPYVLLPGRVVTGVCWIATFSMAMAYLADVVAPKERALAFGIFTTMMGLGFAVGPLLATATMKWQGIRGSYLLASALALAGAGLTAGTLRTVRKPRMGSTSRQIWPEWTTIRRMIQDPTIRAASLSNLVINLTFDALIANFFPLHALRLGVTQETTNSMFSARAVGSTLSRMPAGLLASRLSSRTVLVGALATLTVAMFGFAMTQRPNLLAMLLVLEGVLFGVILMAGQALTAEESTVASRGTAVGFYSMAGSIGNGVAPFLLGLIAGRWGLQAVFIVTGILTFFGLLAMLPPGGSQATKG